MSRFFVRSAMVIAVGMLLTAVLHADNRPKAAEILATEISVDQSTLFIEGLNFGTAPQVILAGMRLGGVTVDSHGRRIIVPLPTLTPGTYLLEVIPRERTKTRRRRFQGIHEARNGQEV